MIIRSIRKQLFPFHMTLAILHIEEDEVLHMQKRMLNHFSGFEIENGFYEVISYIQL